jgi:hypothetical protein
MGSDARLTQWAAMFDPNGSLGGLSGVLSPVGGVHGDRYVKQLLEAVVVEPDVAACGPSTLTAARISD